MEIQELQGKSIAILGYGVEGQSTLRFLLKKDIDPSLITIHDQNNGLEIPININSELGDLYLDNLNRYDIIIKSPGLSAFHPKIISYTDKIISQTQLFFHNYHGKVICVTGTKGKSTTASIIYQTLKNSGFQTKLVGNIGYPVLDEIDINKSYDYVVYELSSYQLDGLSKENFISILLNIYPDHMNRHLNMENYINAKLNVFNNSEYNLINEQVFQKYSIHPDFHNLISFGNGGSYYVKNGFFFVNDEKVMDSEGIKLLGAHNLNNICSVIAVCNIIGIDFQILKKTLFEFENLPHRLEHIGNYNGIDFYDDAISTTPESTIAAIQTFGNKIDTILLGGTDRGYKFEELVENLDKFNIKNIVLFPETGKKIKKLLSKHKNILETNSMSSAVKFALKNSQKGKICLLSTASPSFSLWRNYIDKGKQFKLSVLKFSR